MSLPADAAQPSIQSATVSTVQGERVIPCGGALVTGADYRGLGVVRSLGRRGIPVWVLKQPGQQLGAVSRYAVRSVAWPAAADDQKQTAFLRCLAVAEGLYGWALFPTTDEAVALIGNQNRFLGAYYRLTTPSWEVLRWGCDKRLLHRLATELGVASPWTFCPSHRGEIAALDCPFPVILKPAMRLGSSRLERDKAWFAENRATLLRRYDEACRMMDPECLMIQELLPGGGDSQFSYAALCAEGRPLASLAARRVRQFPRDFGRFSTYVESVDDPGVVEPAVRLLGAMRFSGLVEVEFKRDPRDGKFKVLDVNPRVWGWHTLAARAGIDFPYLAWLLANRAPVPEAKGLAGSRWIRFGADLPMAIQEILGGRLSFRKYLSSLWGSREWSMFAWDDMLPGILALPIFVLMAGRRVWEGRGM